MFLPQNVLYTVIYIVAAAAFAMMAFQDMRIRRFAVSEMPENPNEKNAEKKTFMN